VRKKNDFAFTVSNLHGRGEGKIVEMSLQTCFFLQTVALKFTVDYLGRCVNHSLFVIIYLLIYLLNHRACW